VLTPVVATYRLQLQPEFGFADAGKLVGYLARLGVSHLYLSPILEAVAGSQHGYDVVDPTKVRRELGGVDGFRALVDEAHRHGLGIVLDIVPHHMAASHENPWWWDVLRRGEDSQWSGHFDIDWHPPESRLEGKIVLPILGDHYGRVLDAGEIQLERRAEDIVVRCHEHLAPLTDETVVVVSLARNGRLSEPLTPTAIPATQMKYFAASLEPGQCIVVYAYKTAIEAPKNSRAKQDCLPKAAPSGKTTRPATTTSRSSTK